MHPSIPSSPPPGPGGKSVAKGITDGMAGIFLDPIKGLKEGGLVGLGKVTRVCVRRYCCAVLGISE